MGMFTVSFAGFRSQVKPLCTVALIVAAAQPAPHAGAWAETVIAWLAPGARSCSGQRRRPTTALHPGAVRLRAPAAMSTKAPRATIGPRLLAVTEKVKEVP